MTESTDSNTRRPTVRPRDAASLVIHRQSSGGVEVLMGRRGQRDRFRPGVYVFPGGGLERADSRAKPVKPLHHHVAPEMAVGNVTRRANALAMAAVREAYEEAGLLFATKGDVGVVNHPSWQYFREQGLSPDLSRLDYLGRAITPSFRPLRFHARFFAIDYEHVSGELGGDGELEDLRWIRVDRRDAYKMMEVQELVLDILALRLKGERVAPLRLIFTNRIRDKDSA